MRDGLWDDTSVRTTSARVILDGEELDVDGVDLTSQMSADLPILAGIAVAVTTGSVDWPQQQVVASTVPQPFVREGTWPPVVGAPVAVEVGDGAGQWFRQVTGLVDSSGGSLDEPAVQSKVVDLIDRLAVPVRHDALLDAMPAIGDGGAYRRTGLLGTYVTDLCARAAGFCATPPSNPATYLSVPMMGAIWPERGTLTYGYGYNVPDAAPTWRDTAWGLAGSATAGWDFVLPATVPAVTLTVCLTDQGSPDDNAVLSLLTAAGDGVFLAHAAASDVVQVGIVTAGGQTVIAELDRLGAGKAALQTAWNAGTLTLVVRTPDGRSASGSSTDAAFASQPVLTSATLAARGALGGFLVEAGTSTTGLDHQPTALYRVGEAQALEAMPALAGETALEIITAQARAECASVWLDAEGRLRWASRDVLEADAPAVTKTTELTVDALAWADNLESVREQVVMKYRAPAISRNSRATIPLVELQQQTLDNDQRAETWLEPGGDRDWIMPDATLEPMSGATRAFSVAVGSWFGATVAADGTSDDTEVWATPYSQITVELERIGDVYRLMQLGDNMGAGLIAVTKVPSSAANVPPWMRGQVLPIIRGKGRVDWTDQQEATATGASAASVASYEHDCSWFVQLPTQRARLRDWLIGKVSTPSPVVTGVEIDPDPRLELGDKVRLQDPALTGLEIDLVVTSIRQGWGGDAPAMTLAGRVTRVERLWTPTDPESAWDRLIEGWETSA